MQQSWNDSPTSPKATNTHLALADALDEVQVGLNNHRNNNDVIRKLDKTLELD